MRRTSIIRTAMAALMLAAFMAGPASAASVKAKVSSLKGDVKVRATAAGSWETLKQGASVAEGASVKCGADSEAFLAWGKGNVLKVGALSSITLTNLSEDATSSTSKINLDSGKIFAKSGKLQKGSTFEVKTPTAIAGVRGTGFEATPNSFAVVEGTVIVEAGGKEIELPAGMMTEIAGIGEPPSEPVSIPPAMMTELQATNEATAAISAESAGGESTSSAAPAATATPAATTETVVESVVENAAATIDNVVDTTTIQNSIVDQATSESFLPGNGGLQGTIDIQYGGY